MGIATDEKYSKRNDKARDQAISVCLLRLLSIIEADIEVEDQVT